MARTEPSGSLLLLGWWLATNYPADKRIRGSFLTRRAATGHNNDGGRWRRHSTTRMLRRRWRWWGSTRGHLRGRRWPGGNLYHVRRLAFLARTPSLHALALQGKIARRKLHRMVRHGWRVWRLVLLNGLGLRRRGFRHWPHVHRDGPIRLDDDFPHLGQDDLSIGPD